MGNESADDFFHRADKGGAFPVAGMSREAQAPDVSAQVGETGMEMWWIITNQRKRVATFLDVQMV